MSEYPIKMTVEMFLSSLKACLIDLDCSDIVQAKVKLAQMIAACEAKQSRNGKEGR
jgi:hypothetical protein